MDTKVNNLIRKYSRQLANLNVLPLPNPDDYLTFSAYRRAYAGRFQSINNRRRWIQNLKAGRDKWVNF